AGRPGEHLLHAGNRPGGHDSAGSGAEHVPATAWASNADHYRRLRTRSASRPLSPLALRRCIIDGLRSSVKDGSFRPLPVRERMIPKPGGSGKQQLMAPWRPGGSWIEPPDAMHVAPMAREIVLASSALVGLHDQDDDGSGLGQR